MVFLILFCVSLVLIGVMVYKKGHANRNYFKERNIPYMEPDFIFGSAGALMKKSIMEFTTELNQKIPDSRSERIVK